MQERKKLNKYHPDGNFQEDALKTYEIGNWTEEDADELRYVEEQAWAPWLRFPKNAFTHMAKIYPQGQFLIRQKKQIIAHLATTRFDWDGEIGSLPSWDAAAGASVSDVDLTKMLKPDGTAICLLSMSVLPDYRQQNLSSTLMQAVENYGSQTSAECIIGPFRPSNYGQWRREQRKLAQESNKLIPTDFETYINIKDQLGRKYDRWLGIVSSKHGIRFVKIEPEAMVVEVSENELNGFRRSYHPEAWDEVYPRKVYDCTTEAGIWTIENGLARYVQPNYWGIKELSAI